MDVFNTKRVDEHLICEYFERNERKKSDEAWLKSKAPAIRDALKDTPKSVFGDLIVTVSTPNTSKFNPDKLMEYLETKIKPVNEELYNGCTKRVVDEDALATYIESAQIDIDDLKAHAWEESIGTPRITISRRKREDD